MQLKNKIYNNLMLNGKKEVCEKNLQKSIKFCQKFYKKNHKEIFKKTIIISVPIIKLCTVKSKKRKKLKEFPYVLNKKNRISFGIKNIKKINFKNQNLFKEMISILKKENEFLKIKELEYQNSLIFKKSAFFRWFF